MLMSITKDWEYDDGDTDTCGTVVASGHEQARERVLRVLRAQDDIDSVDPNALTVSDRDENIDPDKCRVGEERTIQDIDYEVTSTDDI